MSTQQQQGNFNFNAFNAQTDRIPARLQICLAQQLLNNAEFQLRRYNNTRAEAVKELVSQCAILRTEMAADATARTMKDATARAMKDAEVEAAARAMIENLAKK